MPVCCCRSSVYNPFFFLWPCPFKQKDSCWCVLFFCLFLTWARYIFQHVNENAKIWNYIINFNLPFLGVSLHPAITGKDQIVFLFKLKLILRSELFVLWPVPVVAKHILKEDIYEVSRMMLLRWLETTNQQFQRPWHPPPRYILVHTHSIKNL